MSSSLTVRCACGREYRPKPEALGRLGRCPQCQQILQVGPPAADPSPVPLPPAGRQSPFRDPATRTHLVVVLGIAALLGIYQVKGWFFARPVAARAVPASASGSQTTSATGGGMGTDTAEPAGSTLTLGQPRGATAANLALLLPESDSVPPIRDHRPGPLLPLNHPGALGVRGVAFVPHQPLAYVVFRQSLGSVLVQFDLESGKPVGTEIRLPLLGQGTVPLLVSPDGRWFVQALSGADHGLRLFDGLSGQPLKTEATGSARLAVPTWTRDGRGVYWANHLGHIASWPCLGDVESPFTASQGKGVTRLALSADGRFLLSGDSAGEIRIWDTREAGRYAASYRGQEAPIQWLETKRYADGVLVLSINGRAGQPLQVEFWDLQTQTRKASTSVPGAAHSVAVTPDWRRVVTGQAEGKLVVFDLSTSRVIERTQPHSGNVDQLAVSSDGRFALSGSSDPPAKQPEATVWLRGLPALAYGMADSGREATP